MKESDKKLITDLYNINSYSGREAEIKNFIVEYITKLITNIKIEVDEYGIYVTKGTAMFPCLIAHLDEVHRPKDKNVVIIKDDLIFTIDKFNHPTGCGGDDKNGIYIALKALKELVNVKLFFPVGEEIGGVGSYDCNLNFFNDCTYLIGLDRRGNSDVITSIGGVVMCSEQFKEDFMSLALSYGYQETSGMFTDVYALKNRSVPLSAINLSVGYYNPHRNEEYTIISDMERSFDLVMEFCNAFTGVYEHSIENRTSKFDYSKSKIFDDDAEFDDDNYFKDFFKKVRPNISPDNSIKQSKFKYF